TIIGGFEFSASSGIAPAVINPPSLQPSEPKAESLADENDKFASFDHIGIGHDGFQAFLKLAVGISPHLLPRYNVNTEKLTLSTGLQITPGQIVALAGDFFGVADKPISDGVGLDQRKERFGHAYDKLAKATQEEINKILAAIKPEFDALKKSAETQRPLEETLKPQAGPADLTATKRYCEASPLYYELLMNNFDHFENDALLAFEAGYEAAIDDALTAYKKSDVNLFADALAKLLFACHFVSDYLASGHTRTPRRKIYQYGKEKFGLNNDYVVKSYSGLAANSMHDEDNKEGLYLVSKACPKGWKAYGDNYYYTEQNKDNRVVITTIISHALNDIYMAYRNNKRPMPSYTKYLPILDEAGQPKTVAGKSNHLPLFKFEDKTVKLRKNSAKPGDKDPYKTDWGLWQLERSGLGLAARGFSLFAHAEKSKPITPEQEAIFSKALNDLEEEINYCACTNISAKK
ncbi:MAG: hypothetical protein ACK4PR_01765, partial [Gammaproteobacteria bacterium]